MNIKGIKRSQAILILGWVSLLVFVASLVSGFGQTNKAPSPPREVPRFQVSSLGFGSPNRTEHGCYIIDTMTGELWVGSAAGVKKVSEALR